MAQLLTTKADLVREIAAEARCDRKTVTDVLDALERVVAKELHAGKAVMLPGICKISLRERPARRDYAEFCALTW